MSYAEIDPIIKAWVQKHALSLFTEFAGEEARFAYFSSNIGECFQISIDSPCNGQILVHVRDIETRNDDALRIKVTVQQLELRHVLNQMVEAVYIWMKRYDASATRHYP